MAHKGIQFHSEYASGGIPKLGDVVEHYSELEQGVVTRVHEAPSDGDATVVEVDWADSGANDHFADDLTLIRREEA